MHDITLDQVIDYCVLLWGEIVANKGHW